MALVRRYTLTNTLRRIEPGPNHKSTPLTTYDTLFSCNSAFFPSTFTWAKLEAVALFLYFSKRLSSVNGVKTTAQISGAEIHGLVGRSRRGVGCLVWKNKKDLIKEAFTSGEEKRSALVVFTWPS